MQREYMYELLAKMKEGNRQAFHSFYDATYQDVYRTVSFLVDHPQDREDVMNEIYMQMWTSLANYDTNRPFHFWLHGLVVRQVQRFRVKRWRRFRIFERVRVFFRDENHWDQPTVLMDGTNQMIEQAIQKLTDKQRTVIILRFFTTIRWRKSRSCCKFRRVQSSPDTMRVLRRCENTYGISPERMEQLNAYGTQNS